MDLLPFCATKDRFFGRGSAFMFVQTALDHKKEVIGEGLSGKPLFSTKRPEFWNDESVSDLVHMLEPSC